MEATSFQWSDIEVFPKFKGRLSKVWLKMVVGVVLDAEMDSELTNMSLVIADDETLQNLNCVYRGIDGPTDVLAFPIWESRKGLGVDDTRFVMPSGNSKYGEIIISYPRAVYQARTNKKTVKSEIIMLIVHGILHLMGYDHNSFNEEIEMWSRQDEIISLVPA